GSAHYSKVAVRPPGVHERSLPLPHDLDGVVPYCSILPLIYTSAKKLLAMPSRDDPTAEQADAAEDQNAQHGRGQYGGEQIIGLQKTARLVDQVAQAEFVLLGTGEDLAHDR